MAFEFWGIELIDPLARLAIAARSPNQHLSHCKLPKIFTLKHTAMRTSVKTGRSGDDATLQTVIVILASYSLFRES